LNKPVIEISPAMHDFLVGTSPIFASDPEWDGITLEKASVIQLASVIERYSRQTFLGDAARANLRGCAATVRKTSDSGHLILVRDDLPEPDKAAAKMEERIHAFHLDHGLDSIAPQMEAMPEFAIARKYLLSRHYDDKPDEIAREMVAKIAAGKRDWRVSLEMRQREFGSILSG
jgi:hypothetical protein